MEEDWAGYKDRGWENMGGIGRKIEDVKCIKSYHKETHINKSLLHYPYINRSLPLIFYEFLLAILTPSTVQHVIPNRNVLMVRHLSRT